MKKLLIVILFFSTSNARSNKEGLKLKIGNRVAIIPYGNELVIHHNHNEQLIQGELFNVSNNKIFLNNIETNNRFIILKDSIKAIKTKATTSNLNNFKTGFAIGSVIGFGVGAATTLYSYLEYKELIGIVYGTNRNKRFYLSIRVRKLAVSVKAGLIRHPEITWENR